MKKRIKIIFLLAFLSFGFIHAQDNPTDTSSSAYSTKKPYHVVLKDGSSYTGFVIKDDARQILLRTNTVGEIYIPKENIKTIEEADKVGKLKKGKYFGDEIYYTRYFFSPSAFSLDEGDANAYMPYGLYTQAQYGVSDNFDAGIGTSWIGTPLTVTLKYTMQLKPNLHFAIGGIGITSTYSQPYFGGGAGYGVLTSGTKASNISIGAGYGGFYSADSVGSTSSGYLVMASAYKRLKPQWSVLFDGLYFPEVSTYIAGPGVRYFRKRKEGEMIDFGILFIGSDLINGGKPLTGFPIISYIVTL